MLAKPVTVWFPGVMRTWHEKLRERREAKGLSQGEAGALVGLRQQSYNSYEQGRTSPSLVVAWQLAQALDFDLDWLMDDGIQIPWAQYREIQRALRKLPPDEAHDRLIDVPRAYRASGRVDRDELRQDPQSHGQSADAPRRPRGTR